MYYLLKDSHVIGRTKSSRADIQLQPLKNPKSLQWALGKEDSVTNFGDIGLSRRHIMVKKQGSQKEVRISMEEGSTPVYVLDSERRLKTALHPDSTEEITMLPNECLIIGCYLLRFRKG